MAASFNIKNELSWSGTPFSLYSKLNEYENSNIETLNLSSYHNFFNVRINAFKNCDIKESLKHRKFVSKLGPSALNPLNSKILHKKCSKFDYDVLIEFGGFQPHKKLPPYYIYTDATHDLKLDYFDMYGFLPFGSENDSIDSIKRASKAVKKIYQEASGIFCMSEWLANSLIKTTGVPKEKVHVVYAGANWHNAILPKNISAKKIDDRNEIHLILVGVDYKGKGMDLAIDSVKYLNSKKGKKYYLHLCGVKNIPNENNCDYIINHSFVDKNSLIKLLNDSDIFVLPSRFDCFGISFVEAMTLGLPCVGRNICAMPEIIDEGINGELITKDDPIELAEKIEKICYDAEIYKSYSKEALKKAKKFTWEKVAENMIKIIENDMNKKY